MKWIRMRNNEVNDLAQSRHRTNQKRHAEVGNGKQIKQFGISESQFQTGRQAIRDWDSVDSYSQTEESAGKISVWIIN